jgi:hypothetical protein
MRMIARRVLIVGGLGAAAGYLLPPFACASAQSLVPIRLLVLRKLGLSVTNHCVAPCIRGHIYDVSDLGDFKLDQLILPAVKSRKPLCDTIERPYLNNKPSLSSIPRGIYGAQVRDDKSKPWMDVLDKRWRIELQGVPHRTAIQFHYGNDVGWSEGCFIVGTVVSPDDNLGPAYCHLNDPTNAIAALRTAVTAAGRNINDIRIAVANDAGLFPNVSGLTGCS